MKKSKKYLLVVLAVLLVLGGGIAVLELTKSPQPEDDGSSEAQGSITVFAGTIYDLKSVTFEQKGQSEPITVEVFTDAENNLNYRLANKPDTLPLKSTILQGLGVYGYQLKALKDLGKQEDLEPYGLTSPQLTVTSVFNDGTVKTYHVGNSNPAGGYYVMLDGDENLYSVSLSSTAFSTYKDLVDTSLIPINTTTENGGSATILCTNLTIGGQNYPEEIVVEQCEPQIHSNYLMKQPAQGQGYYCNDDAINDMIKTTINVTAKDVVCVVPTDEQLAAYGLDNPMATLDYSITITDGATGATEDQTHHLKVGARNSDGTFYGMVDDAPVVYALPSSCVMAWYQIDLFSLRSTFIILPRITDVQEIEVKFSGEEKAHVFRLDRTPKADEEDKYDYTVYNTAGTELTYATFQKYYKTLLSLTLLGDSQEEISGEPLMRVTYRYYDGKTDTVSYYVSAENERQCVTALNGAVYGVVRKSSVDEAPLHAQNMEQDICEIA